MSKDVTRAELLDVEWRLLRIEIFERDEYGEFYEDEIEGIDGYSRYWCKQAVLGVYWIAERVGRKEYELYLTEDIELEGFEKPLKFKPDMTLKRELLESFDWKSVVFQVLALDETGQLSLFEGMKDE